VLRKELAVAHGGVAALLNGGRAPPANKAAREEVHEYRRSKTNEIRARMKEKRERKGGVHGVGFFGELGRDSGE
jgi:hypothetical protein